MGEIWNFQVNKDGSVTVTDNGKTLSTTPGTYDPVTGEIDYEFLALSAVAEHELVVHLSYTADGVTKVKTKTYHVAKRS